MKLAILSAERDQILSWFELANKDSSNVSIKTLSIFSQFMAVKSAGFIELTVQYTFEDYAKNRGNHEISKFVLKSAERLNSLNCSKIKDFIGKFDPKWWDTIVSRTDEKHLSAVDSLKTIRDQVAHGKHHGVGLNTVKDYFDSAVIFSKNFQDIILK